MRDKSFRWRARSLPLPCIRKRGLRRWLAKSSPKCEKAAERPPCRKYTYVDLYLQEENCGLLAFRDQPLIDFARMLIGFAGGLFFGRRNRHLFLAPALVDCRQAPLRAAARCANRLAI